MANVDLFCAFKTRHVSDVDVSYHVSDVDVSYQPCVRFSHVAH